jgi:hypothetical protein
MGADELRRLELLRLAGEITADCVRRELRAYQLLFDLDDVATRIHSGLSEQRDEFEQACFDLGIHVIED